jgi:hypothetical protein
MTFHQEGKGIFRLTGDGAAMLNVYQGREMR